MQRQHRQTTPDHALKPAVVRGHGNGPLRSTAALALRSMAVQSHFARLSTMYSVMHTAPVMPMMVG